MSERILRLLFAELNCVRFRCQSCKAVLELHIDKLGKDSYRYDAVRCPHCSETWLSEQDARHGYNPFVQLRQVYHAFCDAKDKYQVEFVVRDEE